jgi:hypothetical protein
MPRIKSVGRPRVRAAKAIASVGDSAHGAYVFRLTAVMR